MDEWLADVQYNIIDESNYTVEEAADLLFGPEGANPDNAEKRRKFIENSKRSNDDIDEGWVPGYRMYKY